MEKKRITYNKPIVYWSFRIYTSDNHAAPWEFSHEDYDGAPDAGDQRCGEGKTLEDCIDQINEMYTHSEYYGLTSKHETIHYFGTGLSEPGHYFFDLSGESINSSKLDFNNIPFNPEKLAIDEEKGRVKFFWRGDYTILRIEGSCSDKRWGTKSVFFVKDNIPATEMMHLVKSNKVAQKMFEKMDFEVNWPDLEIKNQSPPLNVKTRITTLLKKYSEFLQSKGYIESDWNIKPPFAIDEFLNTLK